MDYNTAKTLLDRYFAGESSLEEEMQLRTYFQQTELPDDMIPYQPLFQFFVQAEQQQTGADFAQKMLQAAPGKRVSLNRRRWSMLAVAAVVVLALTTWFFAPVTTNDNQQTAIDWSQYEPQNEEEALRVTTAAFRKTSTSLRLGLEVATKELKAVKKIVQPF